MKGFSMPTIKLCTSVVLYAGFKTTFAAKKISLSCLCPKHYGQTSDRRAALSYLRTVSNEICKTL